jgi:hypothetical protein
MDRSLYWGITLSGIGGILLWFGVANLIALELPELPGWLTWADGLGFFLIMVGAIGMGTIIKLSNAELYPLTRPNLHGRTGRRGREPVSSSQRKTEFATMALHS